MKITQFIVVALLLNMSVEEVAAIRHHRHHYHHRPHLVQTSVGDDEVKDMILEDPRVKELQKKKFELQDAIEDQITPPPLTPEEEADKFNNEVTALEKVADKQKNLKKVDKLETKIEKKRMEGEDTSKDEAKLAEAEAQVQADKDDTVQTEAEPKKEVDQAVIDLRKSLADVEQKQAKEVAVLQKVKDKLTAMVKPAEQKKTEEEAEPLEDKPKPDLSAFNKNLKMFEAEEAAKEEQIEAQAQAIKDIPQNPAIVRAEAAEQAAADSIAERQAAEEAAQDKAAADAAAMAATKKANRAAAHEARQAILADDDELWTANMPEDYLKGYIQTQVDNIRQQLAFAEAREQGESDSESDSDSDSDDE